MVSHGIGSAVTGRMPEWSNGTGCKPVGESLRRFESCSAHLDGFYIYRIFVSTTTVQVPNPRTGFQVSSSDFVRLLLPHMFLNPF